MHEYNHINSWCPCMVYKWVNYIKVWLFRTRFYRCVALISNQTSFWAVIYFTWYYSILVSSKYFRNIHHKRAAYNYFICELSDCGVLINASLQIRRIVLHIMSESTISARTNGNKVDLWWHMKCVLELNFQIIYQRHRAGSKLFEQECRMMYNGIKLFICYFSSLVL